MAREFEIMGAGAIDALLHRKAKHAPPPGTLCPNCGTELRGIYCHVCGQAADDHHRSIGHLIWEGVEGLTHLDGRLGQTLPPLFLSPGALARDQFEGRRQRHVPPFRLFLISLLVFMFVLEGLFHGGKTVHGAQVVGPGQTVVVPDGKGKAVTVAAPGKAGGGVKISFGGLPKGAPPAQMKVDGQEIFDNGDGAAVDKAFDDLHPERNAAHAAEPGDRAATASRDREDRLGGWLKPRLKKAVENKEYYLMVLFTWAHRLAILLLPILAGLLALAYVRRRQFFIYDHLIVSMQFLSFVFLISALAWVTPDPVRGFAIFAASIWVPINLYRTLRGAYGSKRWTAAIKTVFLWASTLTLFGVLMLGLMTLALAEMA